MDRHKEKKDTDRRKDKVTDRKKIQTEGKIKLQIEKRYRQKERMKKKRQIERGRQIYKQIAKRKDIDIHNKKEKIKAKLPRERYRQRKVIHKSYKEKEE